MEPVFSFDLDLPARGEGTLAQSLHRQLRDAILDGRLVACATLPSSVAGMVVVAIGADTVDRWPTDGKGSIDRWVDKLRDQSASSPRSSTPAVRCY